MLQISWNFYVVAIICPLYILQTARGKETCAISKDRKVQYRSKVSYHHPLHQGQTQCCPLFANCEATFTKTAMKLKLSIEFL